MSSVVRKSIAEAAQVEQAFFRRALLTWFRSHQRTLPWRDSEDPYRVWLSEVMLQQTRVMQALPYYTRFVEAFPTIEALARADMGTVLRLWEGLGYYARARRLLQAARVIVAEHGGLLPADYHALLQLPGVGPYTAGAVASIAFGLPFPAVDGNVRRVLSRYFAVEHARAAELNRAAAVLQDPVACGTFNEALMELGATVCTPAAPACASCPLAPRCLAAARGCPERFPKRRPRAARPHYDVAAGVLLDDHQRLLVQRRPEEVLLGGLWELPGGKRLEGEALEAACARELREELGIVVRVGSLVGSVKHAYTHFRITLYAFWCTILDGRPVSSAGLAVRWVPVDELDQYAFPRANRRILDRLCRAVASSSGGA